MQVFVRICPWGNTFSAMLCDFMGIFKLKPEQNGRHFADDMYKCMFIEENACVFI